MRVAFQPDPGPQTQFMQWDGRYALVGGAAFGGKSELLRWDPWKQIAIETDRVNRGEIKSSTGRAILFRRTMPELREIMDRCRADFKLIDPGAEFHEQSKTWTMSCGYKYMFGQMEEEKDWTKYQGFQFTHIGFDELTSFTEEQYDKLDVWLRSKDPVLKTMLSMRASTNPIGPGLEWVRARFVEIAPPGTPVVVRVPVTVWEDGQRVRKLVERRQIFIPLRVSDNSHVDEAEFAATLSTKSSATRRALLEGDWYVIQGSCFGELWENDVHVCKPFKIPRGWTKFRSGDYGYSWPGLSSIQWWAVDTDGNFVCYRSLTIGNLNAAELAIKIREIEIDNDEWDLRADCSLLTGPLDSSCWNQDGTVGLSKGQTMNKMGLRWKEAPRSATLREQAADQIRQRLTRRSGPNGDIPGIRWFDTCWNYIARPKGKIRVGPIITIPAVPADDTKPDVWDTAANDHDTDACAYACMYRPLVPTKNDVTQDEMDDLARARRRAKESAKQAGKSGYWNFL